MMTQLDHVSVILKANVYFDGKVVSHSVLFPDGTKKTIGIIYPGSYSFNTAAPEVMQIIAGACRYKLAGQNDWISIAGGKSFDVPGNSSFEIAVDNGIAEYLCHFK